MTLVSCHPESFGSAQDKLHEGSGFKIESLLRLVSHSRYALLHLLGGPPMMEEIRIVDTTLRDGNTSLWAHNMTTGMMHPVLRHMDQAGFDAMEFFVSGRFKKVVREQRDDPWDWVRYGQKEIKNTQLRYHGGLNSGFTLTPRCIPRLIIERVVHYGIKVTRLSDPWNDYNVLRKDCLLYTSDAADERSSVDLGGRRIIKKK